MDFFTIQGQGYDSNIYVLLGEKPTIVDTGTGFHSKEILKQISIKIKPSTLHQIILTHEHYDHVGGVNDFRQFSKNNAQIVAHKHTNTKLTAGQSSFAEMLGGVMPQITVDVELHGGEQLLLGDELFTVIYTPGHSKGSICLYGGTSKSLISGDTIFAHGDYGRYDFPGGSLPELVSSIHRLTSLDIINLYPGHGEVVEGEGKNHVLKSYQNIKMTI
ncbi:MAG: MBL fold metallo-hydrolase [Methanobacteriota archaeon]